MLLYHRGHRSSSPLRAGRPLIAGFLSLLATLGVSLADEPEPRSSDNPSAGSTAADSTSGRKRPAGNPPVGDPSAGGAPFDPLDGIDRSGRIPKVKLPDGIKHPERWRYIPEGRLLEGNFFERFLVSSFVAPVAFFDSDVGFGGGVSVTDIDFRGKRRREFAGIFLSYTTEGQQAYSIFWRRWLYHQDLPDGGIIQEERTFVRARAGYSKTLTRRFFGLGTDTEESDETSYSDEVVGIGAALQMSVPDPGDNVVFHFGLGYDHHNLGRGFISGVPDTRDVYPGLFEIGDGYDLVTVSGSLRYDTRDSQANPYDGWATGVTIDAKPLQTDFDTGLRYGMFATGVLAVPGIFHDGGKGAEENPPTDVLAANVFVADTVGQLPFYELPSLGGSNTLRGYIGNRWTDRTVWHAALEHRFWVIPRGIRFTDTIRIERIGLAPFVEAGSVATNLDELLSSRILTSYGVGLRIALERAAIFRADFGFSDEGMNFSLRFGLTF